MKKAFLNLFTLLALILSATQTTFAQSDRPKQAFNPQTYQFEPVQENQPPNIDSIAESVLINALAVWDQPKFYEEAGFKKNGTSLKAKKNSTLVQVDINNGKADVELKYSKWQGNWFFIETEDGWELNQSHYSGNSIPEIDANINPFLQDLNTARLKSGLEWLQGPEFTSIVDSLSGIAHSMEQRGKEIQSLWQTEGDYIVNDIASDLDTTLMDSDSISWHITYSTNPSITWEYEAEIDPTSMLVYHFDEYGHCISALNFITEIEFIEEKIETTNGILRIERLKMSFKMSEIPCLDLPPISFEKTGLKK